MKAVESEIEYHITYAVASFGITFLRLFIAVYIGLNVLTSQISFKFAAGVGILLIMLLDYYDGSLFDKSQLNKIKEWRVNRRILDGTVDRLVIQIVCLSILFIDLSFIWVYLFVLIRELLVSSFVSNQFKKKVLLYPGVIAKIACTFVGITVISYLVTATSPLTVAFCVTMLFTAILALREYARTKEEFERNMNRSMMKAEMID